MGIGGIKIVGTYFVKECLKKFSTTGIFPKNICGVSLNVGAKALKPEINGEPFGENQKHHVIPYTSFSHTTKCEIVPF